MTDGGDGCVVFGKKCSDETKIKISMAQIGEKNHRYGKEHTIETKMKISESLKGEKNGFYGKSHNEETKKKISEKNKGKSKNNIKIEAYNYYTNEYVGKYNSFEECAKILNIKSSISRVINGKRKHANGYYFKKISE